MKRLKRAVGVTGALVLLITGTTMGSATAHHGVSPDPVTACGQVVTANLTLTHSIGPCTGHGLIVRGSNITINVAGFRILGDGSATANGTVGDAGILIDGRHLTSPASNVTVTGGGGTVELFNAGVVIDGGSGNNTVQGLTVRRNHVLGENGQNVSDYGEGIQVLDSDSNKIRNNYITLNLGWGAITLLGDSDSNRIGNDGVAGNGVDQNIIEDNDEPNKEDVFAKQTSGIRLENLGTACPNNNVIDGNKIEKSGNDGIQMFNCATGNIVIKNTINESGRDGVHLFPGANNNYIGVSSASDTNSSNMNTIADSGIQTKGDGINLGGHENHAKYNSVTRSSDDGISLGFCRQNLPTDSVRCFPGSYGNVVFDNDVSNSGSVKPLDDPFWVESGSGIHAEFNTAKSGTVAAPVAAAANVITFNTVTSTQANPASPAPAAHWDLEDDSVGSPCTANTWNNNTETTKNPSCLD